MPLQEKLQFFNETKHSFGRSALLLSGGASVGMYHFGVAKALHTHALLPRIISGASAGSIVCGVLGTRTDRELEEIWDPDFQWEKNFDLNFFGGKNIKRFIQRGGQALYSSEFFARNLRKNMGDYTFLEAFDRTGRIINITVSSMSGSNSYPMLLNYLTTPNVLIWSAVLASAAVPGIFEPQMLMARNQHGEVVSYLAEGLKWQDGTMQSDLPMTRLAELFNVNHFIVSQVNPHAICLTSGSSTGAPKILYHTVEFLKRELKQYLLSLTQFCLGASGRYLGRPVGASAVSLLTQEYEGDITIFNGRGMAEVPDMLMNGTEEQMRRYTKKAELVTWAKLPQVENACMIEFVMDEIVRDLREELLEGKRDEETGHSLSRMISRDMGSQRLPSFQRFQAQQRSPFERRTNDERTTAGEGPRVTPTGKSRIRYPAAEPSEPPPVEVFYDCGTPGSSVGSGTAALSSPLHPFFISTPSAMRAAVYPNSSGSSGPLPPTKSASAGPDGGPGLLGPQAQPLRTLPRPASTSLFQREDPMLQVAKTTSAASFPGLHRFPSFDQDGMRPRLASKGHLSRQRSGSLSGRSGGLMSAYTGKVLGSAPDLQEVLGRFGVAPDLQDVAADFKFGTNRNSDPELFKSSN